MAISDFLNPVLGPLLNLTPFWGILIISMIISVVITLAYKWLTDQDLMKRMKSELKEFQAQIKELRGHPEKAMAVQKKAMETNMKYMMQSMKPTLITFIPIILIFGWLNANMAYEPIMPNEEFAVEAYFEKGVSGEVELTLPKGLESSELVKEISDGAVTWLVKGSEGQYLMEFVHDGKIVTKEVTITNARGYSPVEERYSQSAITKVRVQNRAVKPLGTYTIFGWRPGWLGLYIIFSIVFSIGLRKVLKIY